MQNLLRDSGASEGVVLAAMAALTALSKMDDCMHVSVPGAILQDSFREIGASEEMVQALAGMGIRRPSHVQAAAYRALAADSGYVVLADHAGRC